MRRERMNLRELRPRHGKHLRRGVELHRAGAERNHRSRERQVARFEPLDVAQHLGLGVVAVEDGVLEEISKCARGVRNSHCAGSAGRIELGALSPLKTCQNSRRRLLALVVSSSEMPMVRSSITRKFIRCASAIFKMSRRSCRQARCSERVEEGVAPVRFDFRT